MNTNERHWAVIGITRAAKDHVVGEFRSGRAASFTQPLAKWLKVAPEWLGARARRELAEWAKEQDARAGIGI